MPGKQARTSRATILDVAQMAGVSRQTVSRAINDKEDIDPATKERVLAAARRLDYRPSRHARALRRQGSVTLGLIVSDLTNPYFPEVASGVLEVAKPLDWHVIVSESSGAGAEREALDLLSHQADAIVGYCDGDDDELARHTGGLPVVLLERGPDQTRFGSVGIDVTSGLQQGVAHLVSRGHRRIGMLEGAPPGRLSPRARQFLAQARGQGLPVDEEWIVCCDQHTVAAGGEAMVRMLDLHPDLTAVVGFNDLIAIGAMRAARARGLRIPGDVAVLGFDGLALGELVEPPLTTLRIDKRQVGRLAVEQVARLLAGEERTTGEGAWVRPDLVVRSST
ncbi:LacI family DNA-binding transcriptional regulator [Streptomyces sp. WMMC500]|uniref:LacI family DNA-binding transcriptional regulator n=1 Tax=Streptomyces sp. WMMC500 TaxID=3015154 RepID=UPI00248B32BB|nr:LacI family DNA-binding transcriptional regulator [Streptomyces sp. WMMC500]WBB64349.1 LacI family DNA-binding transcriptional regulator [Streptomyces sp. WMMC500]